MEKEICVLGDTNGNLAMVKHSLQVLGLIDQNRSWVGGAAHLVLMGDIRADRFPWGIAITDLITELNHQAKAAGGNIVRLAGNHDFDEADILLSRRYVTDQHLGLAEILKHLPNPPRLPLQMHSPEKPWGRDEEREVLNLINFRIQDRVKRAELLQLYRQKGWHLSLAEAPLIHLANWNNRRILFTHNPPTEDALDRSVLNSESFEGHADGVEYVNHLWKTCIIKAFESPSEESIDTLNWLEKTYIHWNIRAIDWGTPTANDLDEVNVGYAVHGHTTPATRRQMVGPVEMFAVGSTAGIYRGAPMEATKGLSIMIFGKDGQIHFGENAVRAYRSTYSA